MFGCVTLVYILSRQTNRVLVRGSKAIDKVTAVRGHSPLFTAASHAPIDGGTETVALLLDRGSQALDNPNRASAFTPIHCAAAFGRTDVVALLLDSGTKAINTAHKYRLTPLTHSLFNQFPATAKLLLDRGADRQGKTDLFIAAVLGDTQEVKRILDQDMLDINTPDKSEWKATPLDVAGR